MSTRPPAFTWNEELHFGPPSDPINIQQFLNEAKKLFDLGLSPWLDAGTQDISDDAAHRAINGWDDWQKLSEEARASVEMDCKLDDIKDPLVGIMKSPKHVSYLEKLHTAAVGEYVPKKGKDSMSVDETSLDSFKQAIEQTPLKMWSLKNAKPYIRPGRVSDKNALTTPQLKRSELSYHITHEALITISSYTRNTWYPCAFSRTCQHVLSSLCTLTDVWNCISCSLKGDGSLPDEILEPVLRDDKLDQDNTQLNFKLVGYKFGSSQLDQDSAVIVIEDTAYCDGRGSPDYVDKLFAHLDMFKAPSSVSDSPLVLPPYERPRRSYPLKKGPPFPAVPLRSLTVRINEPYWVLHRGNCEHWLVIDEIRLQNPRDPSSGYPVAIQRTPTFLPLCRICSKVPATLSIINDVRLGESPAMVCQPCWQLFGDPPPAKQDESFDGRVVVVPIVFEKLSS